MKYTTIILISMLLAGCRVNKSISKKEMSTDSTTHSTERVVHVSRSDSTDKAIKKTTTETNFGNAYARKTTIREYFSDELDFGSVDTPDNSGGRRIVRETEIEERGIVNRQELKIETDRKGVSLQKSDSTATDKSDSTAVEKRRKSTTREVQKEGVLWGWWVFAGLILCALFIYKRFTK